MITKQCSKCKKLLKLENYFFNKNGKYQRYSRCKQCHGKVVKQWGITNRDKLLQIVKKYRQGEKYKAYKNKWRKSPKGMESARRQSREYARKRKLIDIDYKLRLSLRTRLWVALTNNSKWGSAVRDLGCSISFFRKYLESRFTDGMTWDNYGRNGWHIDHVRPLKSFNLHDKEDFLKAVNYTNLQPLWEKDNIKKGSHYNKTIT